jgi:hypothetical protein
MVSKLLSPLCREEYKLSLDVVYVFTCCVESGNRASFVMDNQFLLGGRHLCRNLVDFTTISPSTEARDPSTDRQMKSTEASTIQETIERQDKNS